MLLGLERGDYCDELGIVVQLSEARFLRPCNVY